jgi:hypothetical protein
MSCYIFDWIEASVKPELTLQLYNPHNGDLSLKVESFSSSEDLSKPQRTKRDVIVSRDNAGDLGAGVRRAEPWISVPQRRRQAGYQGRDMMSAALVTMADSAQCYLQKSSGSRNSGLWSK